MKFTILVSFFIFYFSPVVNARPSSQRIIADCSIIILLRVMQLYTEQVKRTKRVPSVHVVGEPPLLVASKGVLHIILLLIINNIIIYVVRTYLILLLYALDEMIYTTMIIIMIITIMIRSHVLTYDAEKRPATVTR